VLCRCGSAVCVCVCDVVRVTWSRVLFEYVKCSASVCGGFMSVIKVLCECLGVLFGCMVLLCGCMGVLRGCKEVLC